MPQDNADDRNQDSGAEQPNVPLDPNANRDQLLKKLNCLIAVLEAAIQKVRKNQQDGTADPDRLERIRVNLENTLTICQRAKITLEKRGILPANLPPEVREAVGVPAPKVLTPRVASRRKGDRHKGEGRMSYRDYVELSSFEEYRKFKEMPAIRLDEVQSVDFDQLASDLGKIDE